MELIVDSHQLGPCLDRNLSMKTLALYRNISISAGKEERVQACPMPCKQRSYLSEIQQYHENSFAFVDPENNYGQNVSRCQFHQHFRSSFSKQKCYVKLFNTYSLCLYFIVERKCTK